ncbi:MAG: hypothetical protein OSJ54_12705 [Oscillospiraceae bacterium]|nr:hypothetical protein [Oscillospiraceae bacterium]
MDKTYLTGAELEVYKDEFSDLMSDTVNALVKLADKHNVDRNDTMEHFAELFSTMAEISTFENYSVQ